MSFTETLEALGSWDLELSEQTPDETMAKLDYYGHLVVIDGQVDVAATGNALLAGARYVGVCRARAKPGTYTRSGSGGLYWLGDEDGKGHTILTEISLTNATLAQVVTALLPPTVTVRTVYAQAVPATRYSGKHIFQSRRDALKIALAPFGAEIRVNGDFTVDVGTPAQLYDTTLPLTSKPSPLIVRKSEGSDIDLAAVGGKVQTEGAVWDYSTGVRLLGQTVGTGDDPGTVFATGGADAPSVPWLDPQGNAVKSIRLISESGETTGSVDARAQLQLNRFNRATTAIRVTADDYQISGGFGVGDATYVYDPDSGLLDPATQVMFRGEVIHPAVIRVSSLTTPIVDGMTVAWRTDAGVWLDLTPWVVWESASSREITVGDLPASLSKPSDPVQDRVDAARGNPSTKTPKAPTGLALSTSSAVNPKGTDSAIITASWSAVTQYTDNTTVALSHYELQFRPTFRAPSWQASAVTESTTVDLPVVAALGYDVQVRAVSTGGVASAWTSTASITSAADSTGPATPSDPVVSQYVGLLRIYWNGLTSTGTAMPSDFNRVDVHVGTTVGFAASDATLVSSLSGAGYAHTTAPYGSARFVRFIAYDHNGNPSSSSATISGATVQAADGDIASLSVGKLTAGVLTADVTVSGRFTTALTGARREMNSVGFQAFNASNALTISLDGINNLLTGILQTALSGRRIVIGASGAIGEIQFIAPDGTTGRVRGFTSSIASSSQEAIEMGIAKSGVYGAWNSIQVTNAEQAFVTSAHVGVIFGGAGAAPTKSFVISEALNRGSSPSTPPTLKARVDITATSMNFWQDTPGDQTNFILPQNNTGHFAIRQMNTAGTDWAYRFWVAPNGFLHIYADSTEGRVTIGPSPNVDRSMTIEQYNRFPYGSAQYFRSAGDGTAYRLEFMDSTRTVYIPLWASGFIPSSSVLTKTGVRPFSSSALELIKPLSTKVYRRKGIPQAKGKASIDGPEEIGFLVEDLPEEMVARDETGAAFGVDLYPTVVMAITSVQELARIVEEQGQQLASILARKEQP